MTIRTRLALLAVSAGLLLAACGGGGGASVTQMPTMPDPMPPAPEPAPKTAFSGEQSGAYAPLGAPYVYFDNDRFYVIGQPAVFNITNAEDFTNLGQHDKSLLIYGTSTSPIGHGALLAELAEDIREVGYVRRWASPPTVRVAHGTSDYLIDMTHFVVAMINTALPLDFQLVFDFDPAPAGTDPETADEIIVTFADQSEWPFADAAAIHALGVSITSWSTATGELVTAPIWVDADDSTNAGILKRVVTHELLHSLGRGHPIDLRTREDTIMAYDHEDLAQVLFTLDQEMLQAVYSRLDAGTTADGLFLDLGPWSGTATEYRGTAITSVSADGTASVAAIYGARLFNGHVVPYAYGPSPTTWIWDNPHLSGTASWSGRLIGFTSAEQPVGGKTDMMLDLADLDGTADFTAMEYWSAGSTPTAPGTGTMWLDGDLHYTVQVDGTHGDAFGNYQPGPNDDRGVLDGGFFGPDHEGIGGTLRRTDLTAAFGGSLELE